MDVAEIVVGNYIHMSATLTSEAYAKTDFSVTWETVPLAGHVERGQHRQSKGNSKCIFAIRSQYEPRTYHIDGVHVKDFIIPEPPELKNSRFETIPQAGQQVIISEDGEQLYCFWRSLRCCFPRD